MTINLVRISGFKSDETRVPTYTAVADEGLAEDLLGIETYVKQGQIRQEEDNAGDQGYDANILDFQIAVTPTDSEEAEICGGRQYDIGDYTYYFVFEIERDHGIEDEMEHEVSHYEHGGAEEYGSPERVQVFPGFLDSFADTSYYCYYGGQDIAQDIGS